MADYYPILVRAVASLPNNNARARQELYDRARSIVIEQLRRLGPQDRGLKTVQEQAALEAAIRRIEAELRAGQPRTAKQPAPARPAAKHAVVADADVRPKRRSGYLGKILHALRSNERRGGRPTASDRATMNATSVAVVAAPAKDIGHSDHRPMNAAVTMGEVPNSLGTMLLAITYAVTAMACTGVVYFRGSVKVSAGIIGYPIFLVVIALVLCLFIVPPLAFFRKTSTLPTMGFLFRAIHSASRRLS